MGKYPGQEFGSQSPGRCGLCGILLGEPLEVEQDSESQLSPQRILGAVRLRRQTQPEMEVYLLYSFDRLH